MAVCAVSNWLSGSLYIELSRLWPCAWKVSIILDRGTPGQDSGGYTPSSTPTT